MNLKNNPEFIPLVEWWEKDGKSLVLWLAVAALVVGGYYGWKNHRAQSRAAASEAVVSAYTIEELETAVASHGKSDAGAALKIRLAKSYFDDARYEEALAIYEALKEPAAFADIATVGRAQCLEGLGRLAEAQKAFDGFAEANPSNYLALTAQLGAVRCLCASGAKAEAQKRLETLKAAYSEEGLEKARVEATAELVKRYDPTKKASPAKLEPPKAETPKAAAPKAK